MYHTRSSLKFSGIIWPLNPNEIKSWNKKEKKRKNNQWNFACEWEHLPPIHNSQCTCGYFKGRFEFHFKLNREFEVAIMKTQKEIIKVSTYCEINNDENAWSYTQHFHTNKIIAKITYIIFHSATHHRFLILAFQSTQQKYTPQPSVFFNQVLVKNR